MDRVSDKSKNRKQSPKTRASMKFVSGPAKATRASPYFPYFKLYGLYGTGFAQPNKNPALITTSKMGKMTEPIGSAWRIGLRVSLPFSFAVGSPKIFAMYPWETSWATIETMSTTIKKIISNMLEIIAC